MGYITRSLNASIRGERPGADHAGIGLLGTGQPSADLPSSDSLSADSLSAVFSALADPTRRSILQRLGSGDATVSELAEPFDISLPAISRHLKVLEAAGLITRGRRAQWRTSSLRLDPLETADEWIDRMRSVWNARFERLDAHLSEIQRAPAATASVAASATPSSPHVHDRKNRKADNHV